MVILLSWHNITSDSTDMSTSACSSVHGVYTKHGEKKQRQTTRTCTSYQHITNRTGQPMGWGLKQPLFVSVSKCFRCPHAISEVHIISEKLAHRNALFFPRCSSAEPSKSKNNAADTCPIERLFAKCCPGCKKTQKKTNVDRSNLMGGKIIDMLHTRKAYFDQLSGKRNLTRGRSGKTEVALAKRTSALSPVRRVVNAKHGVFLKLYVSLRGLAFLSTRHCSFRLLRLEFFESRVNLFEKPGYSGHVLLNCVDFVIMC